MPWHAGTDWYCLLQILILPFLSISVYPSLIQIIIPLWYKNFVVVLCWCGAKHHYVTNMELQKISFCLTTIRTDLPKEIWSNTRNYKKWRFLCGWKCRLAWAVQQLKISKTGYSSCHKQFCHVAKTKCKWFLTYCFNHQTSICWFVLYFYQNNFLNTQAALIHIHCIGQ